MQTCTREHEHIHRCNMKAGTDLVLYRYVTFSRHRFVVGDVNVVETSIWKQIKQNLTSAVNLQAKWREGIQIFCLKCALPGETVKVSLECLNLF